MFRLKVIEQLKNTKILTFQFSPTIFKSNGYISRDQNYSDMYELHKNNQEKEESPEGVVEVEQRTEGAAPKEEEGLGCRRKMVERFDDFVLNTNKIQSNAISFRWVSVKYFNNNLLHS